MAISLDWIKGARKRFQARFEEVVRLEHFRMVIDTDDLDEDERRARGRDEPLEKRQRPFGVDGALDGSITTTEKLAEYGRDACARWNRKADQIAAKYGNGFFPLRLKVNNLTLSFEPATAAALAHGYTRLTWMLSTSDRDEDLEWMFDLMLMSRVPEGRIKNEAHGKGKLWDRVLRKRKSAEALAQTIALNEKLVEIDAIAERRRQLNLAILQNGNLWGREPPQYPPAVTPAVAKSHPAAE